MSYLGSGIDKTMLIAMGAMVLIEVAAIIHFMRRRRQWALKRAANIQQAAEMPSWLSMPVVRQPRKRFPFLAFSKVLAPNGSKWWWRRSGKGGKLGIDRQASNDQFSDTFVGMREKLASAREQRRA